MREFGLWAVYKILWADSKRENVDESNMFKENIVKEMF